MRKNKYTSVLASFALMASAASHAASDVYNQPNNQLVIPSVVVGSNVYSNVVVTVGNIVSVGGGPYANLSGLWAGSYGVNNFSIFITQSGNTLTLTDVIVGFVPDSPTSTGVINGNTINVTSNNYARSGTSTLTVIDGTTISAVQNSCTPHPGYQCLMPNGVPITLKYTQPLTPID